jgi:hypothetical protein
MANSSDPVQPLLDAVKGFTELRQRPLLILYYSPQSSMLQMHISLLYGALRKAGFTKEAPAKELDLLIETYGGDPTAAFGLAQTARMFAESLTIVVAEHAFSAGTLLTFGGDSIRMADCASLSPIDITLGPPDRPDLGVELVTLDAFMDFATDIRRRTERMLTDHPTKMSSVESDVLVQMVKDIGALGIGKFYRERQLTRDYARHLLARGIFKKTPRDTDETIRHFLFGAPAHSFLLDSSMCRDRGLPVIDMPTEESDKVKAVADALYQLTLKDVISPFYGSRRVRMPFFQFFGVSSQNTRGTNNGKAVKHNESPPQRRRSPKNPTRALPKTNARNGARRGPVHT